MAAEKRRRPLLPLDCARATPCGEIEGKSTLICNLIRNSATKETSLPTCRALESRLLHYAWFFRERIFFSRNDQRCSFPPSFVIRFDAALAATLTETDERKRREREIEREERGERSLTARRIALSTAKFLEYANRRVASMANETARRL